MPTSIKFLFLNILILFIILTTETSNIATLILLVTQLFCLYMQIKFAAQGD